MMEFPKKAIKELHSYLDECKEGMHAQGDHPSCDPKAIDDIILYAEMANARIKELETDCSGLMFKLRCVAQALK